METKTCTKGDTEKRIILFYSKIAECEDCNTKRVLSRY